MSNAPDQPRTGAGDAINTPARGTRAIVDCIAEYDLMGNEPARVEAAHVELDALVQENMTLRTRLEEAEARERWIPVSERLPEQQQGRRYDVTMLRSNGEVYTARAYTHGRLWFADYTGEELGRVIAWRPLSEPYTPSKE